MWYWAPWWPAGELDCKGRAGVDEVRSRKPDNKSSGWGRSIYFDHFSLCTLNKANFTSCPGLLVPCSGARWKPALSLKPQCPYVARGFIVPAWKRPQSQLSARGRIHFSRSEQKAFKSCPVPRGFRWRLAAANLFTERHFQMRPRYQSVSTFCDPRCGRKQVTRFGLAVQLRAPHQRCWLTVSRGTAPEGRGHVCFSVWGMSAGCWGGINHFLTCQCAAVRFGAIVKDLRHRERNYPSLRDSIKAASPTLGALRRRLRRLHVTIAATHHERHVTAGGLVRACERACSVRVCAKESGGCKCCL